MCLQNVINKNPRKRPILSTFHIAVDFQFVLYKGLYGGREGGGERDIVNSLRNCTPNITTKTVIFSSNFCIIIYRDNVNICIFTARSLVFLTMFSSHWICCKRLYLSTVFDQWFFVKLSPAPRKIFRRVVSQPLTFSFDCYGEARYRKSVPTVPDHRIVVVDYHHHLPDASQLASLHNQSPDQASSIFKKLRRFKRSLIDIGIESLRGVNDTEEKFLSCSLNSFITSLINIQI